MSVADRIHPITMPKWGMTMTEGKIADWLVREGETVEAGQEFVDVETDKIANGVEAERAGTLRRILVPEGQSAPCGSLIAVMADADVSDSEIEAFLDGFAPAHSDESAGPGLTSATIENDGVFLNVVTANARGSGTPAILLHGFGSDAAAWMFNHEALAADRPVHAIDLPSHGASQIAPDIAGFAAMAETLAPVIDALAPDGAHLVGHSLGGRIALYLAARRADVKSLTLIAPAGLGDGINTDFVEGFITADRRRPMKAALQLLVADTASISSDMIERTLSYKRLDGVGDALRAIADANLANGGAAHGVGDDLAALSVAPLVIWGRDDAVLSPDGAGHAGDAARIVILDDAGHMPQMEHANRVNDLIASHMSGAD